MKESVYCPKCDSDNVQSRTGAPGGDRDRTAAAIDGLSGFMLGMFWLSAKQKKDQQYIPVYHHCANCGNDFMSANTYYKEIEIARKQRTKALILGIFWGLLGAVLGTYCCMLFEPMALICTLAFLALAALFIANAVKMWKRIPVLKKELQEMEQSRYKHRNMHY